MFEKEVKEIYLKEIDLVPLLTAEEEKNLALKASSGDKNAQNKLINANLRFVVKIANRYKGFGLEIEELINEGNIGLMKAVEKFDPAANNKFTTYAVWWITAEIQKAIRETSKGIKFPSYMFQEMKKDKWNIASLDKPVGKEDDATIGDLLCDERSCSPEEDFYCSVAEEQVLTSMEILSKKEKDIITLRYGLNGQKPMSLSEVGHEIGLTKERIRQIEKKALSSMKNYLDVQCNYNVAA